MTRATLWTTTGLLGLLAAPAAAQELALGEPFDLGEIIFSASLTPLSFDRTGSTVTVLDGDALTGGPISLSDALNRTPGVSVTQNGGLGTNASVRIRGLDGRYVGVNVNGIDVSDPSSTQTQFNFGGLVGAGIARTEILRGSQSALYGSNAIGGVIDITTMRGDGPGASGDFVLEGGSFGTALAGIGYASRDERGGFSFCPATFGSGPGAT